MTDLPRPGLQPVSHLKAGPTTSSSRSTALHSPTQPPFTRPSSRLRANRTSSRNETIDTTSEKATLALIRRVLCPQASSHGATFPQPLEELLPPLTSSNDVDRQLYAIIAIIIKEFVYSWYSKITPDQVLVNEVLQVVAHCTRALEQRIRQIDVAQLALDEIPALVEAHIHSYRLAKQQSHLSGLPTSHRALYHELNPHPGLSPVPDPTDPDTITAQGENEAVYQRLLANGVLAVLLPTEDLENSSLRTLVGDVLADLILGKEVAGRMCEGWFFWEVITKLASVVRRRKEGLDSPDPTDDVPANRLERFGLLSPQDEIANSKPAAQSRLTLWLWKILQSVYLGYVALRFIVTGLFRVASNPGQGGSHGADISFPAAPPGPQKKEGVESSPSSDGVASKRPILDYRLSSMVSQLLGISQRMPWLSGLLALSQHLILAGPGRLGDTDGVLDRFLRETIEEYVLPPTLLPNLLLATRSTLFPANARPSSLGVALNIGAPASTPQVSVQPPPPSGKTFTTVPPTDPILEGVRIPVSASDASGKSNADSSSSNNVGSGGDHLLGALSSGPTVLLSSSSAVDAITTSPTAPTKAEKSSGRSNSEIVAIKRRCAASLLVVIPRHVARTFFGLPAPSSGDRTCSAATGDSPSLTTLSPSPPSSIEEGGVQSGSCETKKRNAPSSASSLPSSVSTTTIPESNSGNEASGRQRMDEEDDAEIDPEELYLLEAIETDLLDLLADEYCNKHLVYSIIEAALAKVLPEMAERSVAELMEDRGVAPVPGGFQTT